MQEERDETYNPSRTKSSLQSPNLGSVPSSLMRLLCAGSTGGVLVWTCSVMVVAMVCECQARVMVDRKQDADGCFSWLQRWLDMRIR